MENHHVKHRSIGQSSCLSSMNGNVKNSYVEFPEGNSWGTEDVYGCIWMYTVFQRILNNNGLSISFNTIQKERRCSQQ